MSTTTDERTTWLCENCLRETPVERKRCRDCGTSRY
jgi:RNA polymerase subunit RPABC4/transcription elongation factor Spt4